MMPAPSDRAAAMLLHAARELVPQIAASADEIELRRSLPEPLVQALADADLWRMLIPTSLDGGEADPDTFLHVVEAVATADGSTAWCLCQGAVTAVIAARLNRQAAKRIFAGPRDVVAWGPGTGTATEVDDGYRLTGSWSFASGIHHATWLGGFSRLGHRPGGRFAGKDSAPEYGVFLFPASSAEILDVWHVSGLRGTGSDSFTATDLFVPHAYLIAGSREGTNAEAGPLYVLPQGGLYAAGFGSVALGIARGALNAFIELAGTKTPRGARSVLRDNAVVQAQIGRAEARLRSARAFLHETIGGAWRSARIEGALSPEDLALLRLASTHAIHAGARVVDTVYHAAGATAIFTDNPFERRFRDVNAVTQQIQGSQAHFEAAGQFFLGLDVKFWG